MFTKSYTRKCLKRRGIHRSGNLQQAAQSARRCWTRGWSRDPTACLCSDKPQWADWLGTTSSPLSEREAGAEPGEQGRGSCQDCCQCPGGNWGTDESKYPNYRTLFFHHFLLTAPHPHTGRSAFTETDVLGWCATAQINFLLVGSKRPPWGYTGVAKWLQTPASTPYLALLLASRDVTGPGLQSKRPMPTAGPGQAGSSSTGRELAWEGLGARQPGKHWRLVFPLLKITLCETALGHFKRFI